MELYSEISRNVRALMRNESPLVEPLSIDEAFIDLTGIARNLEQGVETAARLQSRIREDERLTASVGISSNKFLAKVASDMEKPNGRVVLGVADVPAKLWPLPIRRLWGVGPKTAERLEAVGLTHIRDIAHCDLDRLIQWVGEGTAEHLHRISNGVDDRPVHNRRGAKSISEERTYGDNLTDPAEIDRALLARAEGVARQLRRNGMLARTVQIKVRRGDFKTWTRAETLSEATDLAEPFYRAGQRLLSGLTQMRGVGVRLLGLGVRGLQDHAGEQSSLFESDEERRERTFARVSDRIRDRIGEKSVVRARLLKRKIDRTP